MPRGVCREGGWGELGGESCEHTVKGMQHREGDGWGGGSYLVLGTLKKSPQLLLLQCAFATLV